MTEHRRNIFVNECFEAVAWYSEQALRYRQGCNRRNTLPETANRTIAEAYLMRADTLTNYNEDKGGTKTC